MLHVANHTHNRIRSFYNMFEASETSDYQILVSDQTCDRYIIQL